MVKVRTKLVEAGYVILGADLLAREVPAELQELIGASQHRGNASETSIPIALTRCPCLMIHGLSTALFVDAQRPYVMVNKPEKYADRVERKAANIKAPKLSWDEVYEWQGRSAGLGCCS